MGPPSGSRRLRAGELEANRNRAGRSLGSPGWPPELGTGQPLPLDTRACARALGLLPRQEGRQRLAAQRYSTWVPGTLFPNLSSTGLLLCPWETLAAGARLPADFEFLCLLIRGGPRIRVLKLDLEKFGERHVAIGQRHTQS